MRRKIVEDKYRGNGNSKKRERVSIKEREGKERELGIFFG